MLRLYRAALPVFMSIGAAGFTLGLILPVTTAVLEERSASAPLIGLTGTIMFLGTMIASLFVGRAIQQYGVKTILGTGLVLTGVSVGALSLLFSIPYWLLLRFSMGAGLAFVFTSSETLINRTSSLQHRGKTLGLYGMAFSLSMMLGPLGLVMLAADFWLPFVFGAMVCLLPVPAVSRLTTPTVEKGDGVRGGTVMIRRIFLSLSAMSLSGFMEGALLVLIPLYTLRQGFSSAETGLLLFCFLLGHGCMPLLSGMLSDFWGFNRTLLAVIIVGIPAFMLVPFVLQLLPLAMLFMICGASVGSLYPLSIGLLANVLTYDELPRGNAMTTFCYGMGSVLGPIIPALIMHYTGVSTLFVVAALVYVIFLGVWLLRGLSLHYPGRGKKAAFFTGNREIHK